MLRGARPVLSDHRHARGLSRTVLFDTGPDPLVFTRNVRVLKIDLGQVDAVMLSHGHWDHSGAFPAALDLAGAGSERRIPLHMHPGMFDSRAMRGPDGAMRPVEDVPSVESLTAAGAGVVLARDPETLLDAMFEISGEIPRLTSFEKACPASIGACRTAAGSLIRG